MSRFLITGGTRGIGLAVAEQLIAAGHDVWVLLRPGATAPPGCEGEIVADLGDPAALRAEVVGQLAGLTAGGGLDGVVHSAGIARSGDLAAASVPDWTSQFAANVVAVAELTQALLPALRQNHGTVLVVNSGAGLAARSPRAPYAATKHAVRAWADALREEEPSVRVSTVYPGKTDTDMQHELVRAERGEYAAGEYLTAPTVAQVIVSTLLLPADGVLTDVVLKPRPRS